MLRLPEIGSHAAFKQLLSQRIHNSRLKRFDKKKLKLAVKPPRGSPQWKQAYNKRTSAERANKRIKIDGLLEEGRHRSSMMWYIRLFAILSVIHIDAWHERKCESA